LSNESLRDNRGVPCGFPETLLFAALILATPFHAVAQLRGWQGELPSGPSVWPPPRPPACQYLLTLRDELQIHGIAIQEAKHRKASVEETCRLFKAFLSTEVRFIDSLEKFSRLCGVAPEAIRPAKEAHIKASQVGKRICGPEVD